MSCIAEMFGRFLEWGKGSEGPPTLLVVLTIITVTILIGGGIFITLLQGIFKARKEKKRTTGKNGRGSLEIRARVIQLQKRDSARYSDYADVVDPDNLGTLSFNNNSLDEYTIWVEFVDTRRASTLGLRSVVSIDGFAYRREWDSIPENAVATLTLDKMYMTHSGEEGGRGEGWNISSIHLNKDGPSGSFIAVE